MVMSGVLCGSVWSLVGKGREEASRGWDVTVIRNKNNKFDVVSQNWSLVHL